MLTEDGPEQRRLAAAIRPQNHHALTAVHVHRGPYEELATAWPAFVQWVLANGYQPAGPPQQVFKGDFSTPNVEMRMPVQK